MKFLLPPVTACSVIGFARHAGCRRPRLLAHLRLNALKMGSREMSGTYEAYAEALDRKKMRSKRRMTDPRARAEFKDREGKDRDGERGATTAATRTGVRETTTTTTIPPGHRLYSNGFEEPISEDADAAPPLSFPALGFDDGLVRALHTAFPSVQRPTRVQERLVPEIMAGRDVLLRDATGSGKTFGLVLALLNKPRVVHHDAHGGGKRRVVTTLFVVPHRDLALQILHWVERITQAMRPAPPLASIAQVLVRGSSAHPLDAAVQELKDTPPHILICTPQALVEVYKSADKEALRLDTLSTVVVDEVDYLVETAARKEEGKSFWKAHEKRVRQLEMHPGPTREMLDVIYAGRKALAERGYEEEADEEEYASAGAWRNAQEAAAGHPQLVLASATLRVHLKDYLFAESGWLNAANVAKIMGEKTGGAREKAGVGRIMHSVLVVSEGGAVRNVDGAVAAPEGAVAVAAAAAGEEEEEDAPAEDYYNEKYGRTPSPFNAAALEGIATAFALDVPAIGLLVVPSSAPVQRAVWELRGLGVNAEGLDVQIGARGRDHLLQTRADVVRANPRLLVATLATTRGLDLPELSHVFVLGVPEGPKVTGRAVDAYVHIAGRVGRFGRAGRVITVVEGADGWRMERLLGSIGQRPVRFEHFD